MPEKIGVYIDESSIAPYLSAETLAEYVQKRYSSECPVVKTMKRLNTMDGQKLIQDDLDSGDIDSVAICGTSPRVDWDLFDFGDQVLVERINLREQCVLCYKNPDGTVPAPGDEAPELLVKMAQDYINMGIAKLQKSAIPVPENIETVKTILVLGGGFTGLTAALHGAKMKQDVVLVEKESELGGKVKGMLKTFPMKAPYDQAHDTGIDDLIAEVTSNPKIKVFTGAGLEKLKGAPGKYQAVIKNGSGEETLDIGAVVLATGWVPQDTKYLEPMGYGTIKNMVTTAEFEAMAKSGRIARPSDGKTPDSVAFLLDIGLSMKALEKEADEAHEEAVEKAEAEAKAEEDGECEDVFKFEPMENVKHLAYSSELNSLVALKQAGYVREANDDATAFILYKDMMVPGINERYYRAAQDDPGVMLSKAEISSIRNDADGGAIIAASNSLLGEDVEFKADMVVVPTGMVPTTALDPTINLEYRQGPAFPDLDLFDGFADSNYICFPYETRRTGVYAAGPIRQPMTMSMCEDDAAGAMLKAIQCVNSANHGVSVHPRSGDNSFPVFNFLRCTQCKRCTEECPFGALDDDEKGTPLPNPTRCRRCGTCMGACPERVISFDNYNIDQIGTAIKKVEVPDDINEGGPRIIVLACENDAYPALDMAAMRGHRWSPYVRFLPVRCLGSVNAIWVADAMSKGVDGFLMLGCKYGEDYQCHFVKGSELCSRRAENIAESLNRLGVEPERVHQEQIAIDEYDQLPGIIDKFVDFVLSMGPNPFKGY